MALPTSKQVSNNTPPIEEPGNYEATLKAAALTIYSEYKTEAFNDGDGLRYQGIELLWDVDGTELRERFVRVSLNDRAKLYNRVSALLGRPLTEEDNVDWGVNSEAETNRPIDRQYFKADKDDAELNLKKGEWHVPGDVTYDGIIGALDHLKVNGENLFGKTCLLNITINKAGYNRMDDKAATPLPKSSRRKPQPVQTDDAASGMPL